MNTVSIVMAKILVPPYIQGVRVQLQLTLFLARSTFSHMQTFYKTFYENWTVLAVKHIQSQETFEHEQ